MDANYYVSFIHSGFMVLIRHTITIFCEVVSAARLMMTVVVIIGFSDNDLDEKVRKMAEIIIEKPTMQKVIYKLEKPSEELAFGYYILFISSHAYSMHQKNVLDDEEWTGWLQWMRNCFKYGTIGEQWKQIRSEKWLNRSFEDFLNKEIISEPG